MCLPKEFDKMKPSDVAFAQAAKKEAPCSSNSRPSEQNLSMVMLSDAAVRAGGTPSFPLPR